MNPALAAGPRDGQWKKVDEAAQKGLPKTAIDALDPIIKEALADKAYAEATRAIVRRTVLEGTIQGDKPEERIMRLESEMGRAPKEITPLLETILAHWYWQYFQQNRWRFMRRTATAHTPGRDFTTWDLPRLFAEIDKHFQKALANAHILKHRPIATFDDLLEKGSLPDAYRPTLYDFIAHEALSFYTAGEQAAAKPQDAYELPAESPALDDAQEFIRWESSLAPTDFVDSPIIRALHLYAELLKFHRVDNDPTAFAHVDLARLAYAHSTAFGETKNVRYKSALKAFVDRWADHELSALALHYWARLLQQERDLVEAHRLAERGAKVFPESPGGRLCRNLITEINSKSFNVATERVWNNPWPKIEVRYRNLTNIHFRAVAYDWNAFLDRKHNRPDRLNDQERKELLARKPVFAWSADLPPTKDYQERVERLPAPDRLEPGFYFLLASCDPAFGGRDNQVTFTDIWVSELALVVRSRHGRIEGFVLEANSGEPIPGAEVAAWHLDAGGNRIPIPHLSTDTNGFFTFAPKLGANYLIRVRHNGRELASQDEYSAWRPERHGAASQTLFFTDRAIYRPGQTIQYKGICLHVDQEKDDYNLLAGTELTVVLADPNNKEVARQKHRCNDHGSFAGSFTAPRDRLLGQMRIYVAEGPPGAAHFSVEEYKRPKFEVVLDAPETAPRLDDKVILPGRAMNYTGAAVDAAQVRYRVVREVRWPAWWSWRQHRVPASQEIAHGLTQTATDGTFKIEFVARPDRSIPEREAPTFSFRIYAEVTDGAGETRSAERRVNVGYTALEASVSADDWQTEDHPVQLKLTTITLDGEPQRAEGALKVYRLKEPPSVHRPLLIIPQARRAFSVDVSDAKESEDLSDPNQWPLGELLTERGFTTDAKGEVTIAFNLGVGAYRAVIETKDRFGKQVTAHFPVRVLNPSAANLPIKIPHLFAAPSWSVEPGETFMALWGTGYDTGRAFIEIEHRNQMIQQYWTKPGETQVRIKQAVSEKLRGGFTVHVTRVRENRAYLESRHVEVPWSNKQLDIKWEHFTSRLQPSQKETWTALITVREPKLVARNQLEKTVAEMVATLYDASLDTFLSHNWPQRFGFFRQDYSSARSRFENRGQWFAWLEGHWDRPYLEVQMSYRRFPPDVAATGFGYAFPTRAAGVPVRDQEADARSELLFNVGRGIGDLAEAPLETAGAPMVLSSRPADRDSRLIPSELKQVRPKEESGPTPGTAVDLSRVAARKNLNETAFFFPQLVSDSNGLVRLVFSMPEALTQWRFMGFAHDRELRSGFLENKAVTTKDLMVQPNPPRFMREGDLIEFSVKVSNQSTARQIGKVQLTFRDALTDRSVDGALGLQPAPGQPSTPLGPNDRPDSGKQAGGPARRQSRGPLSPNVVFEIPPRESRSFSWCIRVPDGQGFLIYKAVGATDKVSDGEEGYLPVLSRRLLVTESLPLPIRGPATKKFEFARLLKSGGSKSLQHQSLIVQVVSNPSWYAVLALPYLMEFPHECSEQLFNRLYANALARFIALSDPNIRRVFDQWKNTPALDSPLEKDQDLKSVVIEETPWLRQAESESQARRNVGNLFDDNRLGYETEQMLHRLQELQLADGTWPWFPGGPANEYITLYITTGFGRLRHLGVDLNINLALHSLDRLDLWIDKMYRDILKRGRKEDNHLSPTVALYLYGRSFFLKDRPIPAAQKEAVDFFLDQAKQYWTKLDCRQSQGHLALALNRFGDSSTARTIMKSIQERSVSSEELGMFWRDTELSWWWYRAPIETQALMIEAFDEVMHDDRSVENCKVWLLKQKQTQDWKTTKATADAVYALLLRGAKDLASQTLVEVKLDRIDLKPKARQVQGPKPEAQIQPEPGAGFYEKRFTGAEVRPKLGEITVKKVDDGVAWGSVHWQYLEDMAKVKPYAGTPLRLKKALFTKKNTNKGPVLEPVNGPLHVGDELVVRLELRVDRDIEYVHLKDQRGSGTEPLNVLSGYRYQDGLAYYESTRDTASHFFIDYMPKGTYVFEYSTRVQLRGRYETGVASLQCMYAPEFNSHSDSLNLDVK
jgi:hypothetical protein